MYRFVRAFFSWKTILLTTGISVVMLASSILSVGLRSYALPVGFAAALLHFMLSTWLWRDFVYGGADFDSEYSYAPSGVPKSWYMLVSFIFLLALTLGIAILDVEQGCRSSFMNAMDLC